MSGHHLYFLAFANGNCESGQVPSWTAVYFLRPMQHPLFYYHKVLKFREAFGLHVLFCCNVLAWALGVQNTYEAQQRWEIVHCAKEIVGKPAPTPTPPFWIHHRPQQINEDPYFMFLFLLDAMIWDGRPRVEMMYSPAHFAGSVSRGLYRLRRSMQMTAN